MEKEKVKFDGNSDALLCICGNTPSDYGFFTCDKNGNEMEPLKGVWLVPLYVCDKCGRIINYDTLEVVGKRAVQPVI